MIPLFLLLQVYVLIPTIQPPNDPRTDRYDWSVIIQTYNGHVSVIRELSLREAEEELKFADNRPKPISGECCTSYSPWESMYERGEILGPKDWDGCPKAFHHHMVDASEIVLFRTWFVGDKHSGMTYHFRRCAYCKKSDDSYQGWYSVK
jgi:hypothetical protein